VPNPDVREIPPETPCICPVELYVSGSWLSGSQIIRNSLALLGIFVDNSTKLTCLEITGGRIKYSTML